MNFQSNAVGQHSELRIALVGIEKIEQHKHSYEEFVFPSHF